MEVGGKWYLKSLPSISKFCSIYNLDILMFDRVMAMLALSPELSRYLAHRRHSEQLCLVSERMNEWLSKKNNSENDNRFWV